MHKKWALIGKHQYKMEEGSVNEKSSFPGLNKSHGFFNLIERNQRDRESYHQEQEERKQVSETQPAGRASYLRIVFPALG